ncbi:hypothetical protein [Streptomyces triculaminicus]|uniref:hypothetical protein n=1 Tax=Streptomyces triculaminicus TaxID=2816232 RepID=UPI0037A15EEC
MPVLTPCPGNHNNAWRHAEAERESTGIDHELQPAWGDPIHCTRCALRARSELADVPELLAAVWLESLHGTRPRSTGTIGRAPVATWPGEACRLLTDHIVGAMLTLEDDIRDLRRLQRRRPTAEGAAITSAVRFLSAHLDWALTDHPAAAEVHDRLSANPAAQIHSWHTAATRFTRRDTGVERYAAPCPRCDLLGLFRADGDDYIECRNVACGLLLTPAEYAAHTTALAASYAA